MVVLPDLFSLRSYDPASPEEIAAFIARLNAQPEHHIAYFGTTAENVAHYLLSLTPSPREGFVLAHVGETLVGVMGAEWDTELGRAWLHGPWVEVPAWQAVAEQLYAAVLQRLPKVVDDSELVCDMRNQRCQTFAKSHGYRHSGEAVVLLFERERLDCTPTASAHELDDRWADSFQRLHDHLFPGTYNSGRQLLGKRDLHNRIMVLAEGGRLQGYACANVAPGIGEGYIEFIGVAEESRRQGLGRRLLLATMHWVFSFTAVDRVGLTVDAANQVALGLYEGVGFKQVRTVCGFRKRREEEG